MSLEKRIIQIAEMISNVHHIDINVKEYKKLKQETLNILNLKNIKIYSKNNIKGFKFYIYKPDCFAYKNENCTALKNIDCNFCKFYKNDITLKQIEKDIEKYCN